LYSRKIKKDEEKIKEVSRASFVEGRVFVQEEESGRGSTCGV
jgi:hypothetical protein